MARQQNNISAGYFEQPNLQKRVEPILELIEQKVPFKTDRLLQESKWWSSPSVGAMHYLGSFKKNPAILKIQGVKPATSEAENIAAFANQNESKIIRPPKVYFHIPWDKEHQFEALIIEKLSENKLVGLPATKSQIDQFGKLYQEYRKNCLQQPWLKPPSVSLAKQIQENFAQWRQIAKELHPTHPLRQPADDDLIDQAVAALIENYQTVQPEFQHGHFSARDLHPVGKQFVLLSNLYWGWRAPYYDAVFAAHWYQFDLLEQQPSIKKLTQHRAWWKESVKQITKPANHHHQLLSLALLERAAAGLNLDGLVEPTPTAHWLMDTLRTEIKQLLTKLP